MSCPHCAQDIPFGTVVCPHCRTVVHPQSVPVVNRTEPARPPEHAGAVVYFLLGAAGLIAGAAIALNAEEDGGALFGNLVAVVGFAVMFIGVIAKGVEVGIRSSRDSEGR